MNTPRPNHTPHEKKEQPVTLLPIYDTLRGGSTPPLLIGYLDARNGLILTEDSKESTPGTKGHQNRIDALKLNIQREARSAEAAG